MPRLHPGWVLVGSALLGAATCSNTKPQDKPAAAPLVPVGSKPALVPSAGNGVTPVAPLPALAKADFSGLSEHQKGMFAAIAQDEFCPCDCPQTLAACLTADAKCPAAPFMAEIILRDIRDGMPPDMLKDEMAAAFSGGYSAKPHNLILDGYGTRGPNAAPITVVEYSDFECPHCKDAAPILKQLVQKYPGEVRLVFKHFPLSGHVMARDAAVAVEAAGRQGKFWEMHDRVFEHQDSLSADMIKNLARQINLDLKRFEKDREDPSLAAKVEASRKEGEALGIDSTPTVYVNGRKFGLRRSPENFESRLAMERVRGQGACK